MPKQEEASNYMEVTLFGTNDAAMSSPRSRLQLQRGYHGGGRARGGSGLAHGPAQSQPEVGEHRGRVSPPLSQALSELDGVAALFDRPWQPWQV